MARGDVDWESEIIVAIYRLEKSTRPRSPDDALAYDEWERHHDRFHRSLIAACGSPWLLHFCELLSDQYQRYRRLNLLHFAESEELWTSLRNEHRPIADIVLKREIEKAVSMSASHFDGSKRRIIDLYKDVLG